jgi:hypothetical protein
MDDIDDLLRKALDAGGTPPLPFGQMLHLLEVGHAKGLVLYSVDVIHYPPGITTLNKSRPPPEWMFRLSDEELETVSPHEVVPMALGFYRQHAADPELAAAYFEVFFELAD